jgi:hypothetical protein
MPASRILRFARTSRWARVAAQRPQRQRHTGVHGQGRVAAREDQPESVVHDRAHGIGAVEFCVRIDRRELFLDQALPAEELRLLRKHPSPPEAVDRPVPRRRRDPGAGVVRDPPFGPRLEGRDEGILDRFLGEVEVTEHADQGGHRPPLLLAEQAVDDGARILGRDGQRRDRTGRLRAAIVGRQPAALASPAAIA